MENSRFLLISAEYQVLNNCLAQSFRLKAESVARIQKDPHDIKAQSNIVLADNDIEKISPVALNLWAQMLSHLQESYNLGDLKNPAYSIKKV